MAKSITLRLDRFGREALEACVRSSASSESSALVTAVRYYLADRESGRPGWRVPRLGDRASGEALEVELQLDDPTFAELEREATGQDVTPERLARYALLYLLADLDAGRVAGRLGDALRRDAGAETG